MEQQLSFADSDYHHKRHQTRKEKFLARLEIRLGRGWRPWWNPITRKPVVAVALTLSG